MKENTEHLAELEKLVNELGLDNQVLFVPSCTGDEKHILLSNCEMLLYTPENEHFGIVPLEAMTYGKPVIACASGGPLETIVHGETGYLIDPTPEAFAHHMDFLLLDRMRALEMGKAARVRVEQNFSRDKFGKALESICITAAENREVLRWRWRFVRLAELVTLVLMVALLTVLFSGSKSA